MLRPSDIGIFEKILISQPMRSIGYSSATGRSPEFGWRLSSRHRDPLLCAPIIADSPFRSAQYVSRIFFTCSNVSERDSFPASKAARLVPISSPIGNRSGFYTTTIATSTRPKVLWSQMVLKKNLPTKPYNMWIDIRRYWFGYVPDLMVTVLFPTSKKKYPENIQNGPKLTTKPAIRPVSQFAPR